MASNTNKNVVVSKTDDGNVSIVFTIPWNIIDSEIAKASEKLGKGITVPGFRQGKAPADVLSSHLPKDKVVQEVIGTILPPLITKAYSDNDIKPVMYPKVELLHGHDNEDWEIRVTTAQFPEIKLGDYKKIAKDALTKEVTPETTQDQKESISLKALIDNLEVKLPSLLVEEESNHRIANLLARIEKLGLTLENYLASQKKDVETLKAEYATQSSDALKLELILGKIAEVEKITVHEDEVNAFGQALLADPKKAKEGLTIDDKANIRTLLLKRKAIESLVS